MRALPALLVLALAACAARRAAPLPEPEPAPSSSSGGVVIVDASASVYVEGSSPPASGGTCSAMLRVHDVRIRSGCVIDERVTAAPGRLVYPCGGGPANATFGGSTFSGAVSAGGDVDLEIRTAFHFTDGCDWETKQFLRGNLGSGMLSYEYREEPQPGQGGCAAACVGTASASVTPG